MESQRGASPFLESHGKLAGGPVTGTFIFHLAPFVVQGHVCPIPDSWAPKRTGEPGIK